MQEPHRERSLNGSHPPCLEATRINIGVDWVELKPQRWNTASVTMFLKSTTDPVIVFSFGIDNSIEGLTGLHVHQIHKAPHGSTTETSQMSMKSLPEGFMKDLSSETVFASV